MSRVHDMGGRFGDGPVRRDADPEPVFKEEWQAHALALTTVTRSPEPASESSMKLLPS